MKNITRLIHNPRCDPGYHTLLKKAHALKGPCQEKRPSIEEDLLLRQALPLLTCLIPCALHFAELHFDSVQHKVPKH